VSEHVAIERLALCVPGLSAERARRIAERVATELAVLTRGRHLHLQIDRIRLALAPGCRNDAQITQAIVDAVMKQVGHG